MTTTPDEMASARIAIAMDYFRKVDEADPTLLDLMTDDIQLYFPKFGVGYGKAEVAESATGLQPHCAPSSMISST